ncbi:MAG: Na+/H+ antiporter subunit E [Firmicutes bacterium]|nr:Na+/H+ antiporter subunit E [Bacillota bacterium]MBR6351831.1 Na+/H+ antiporter subunit E [Bacillota bacterium]
MLAALFIFWIIFNGRVSADVLISGVLLSAAVFLFACRFTAHSIKKEKLMYKELPHIIRYAFVLVIEIIKSTFGVLHFVIRKDCSPHPKLIKFRAPLKTKTARVMLANSITLTPGTITAGIDGDILTVHCLDGAMGDGIEDSVFVKLLQKMEEVGGV